MSLEEVWIVCDGPERYIDEWEIVSVHASEAGAAETLAQRPDTYASGNPLRWVERWQVKP